MCVTHQSVMTRWLIWTLRRRLRESQKGFLDTSISASFLIKPSSMMYLGPVAIHNGHFVYCPLEISRDEDTFDSYLWTCSMTRPVNSPVKVIFSRSHSFSSCNVSHFGVHPFMLGKSNSTMWTCKKNRCLTTYQRKSLCMASGLLWSLKKCYSSEVHKPRAEFQSSHKYRSLEYHRGAL